MIKQTLNFVRARKQQRKEPGGDVLARQEVVPVLCTPRPSDERVSRADRWNGETTLQRKPQPCRQRQDFSILRFSRIEWNMVMWMAESCRGARRGKPSQGPRRAAAAPYGVVLSRMDAAVHVLLLRPVE